MNNCLPDKSEFLAYVIIILKSQNEMIVNSVTVTSHRNHFEKQKNKNKTDMSCNIVLITPL